MKVDVVSVRDLTKVMTRSILRLGAGMTAVNIHQAKTHLSRLLERVATGEEVVIAKAGRPVARLVPYDTRPAHRTAGQDVGTVVIAEDFDAPLSEELLAEFES